MSQPKASGAGHPLDRTNLSKDDAILAGLQGNILSPHGRNCQAVLLFRFKSPESTGDNRAWIKKASGNITTALQQAREGIAFKAGRDQAESGLHTTIMLSATGLQALGAKPQTSAAVVVSGAPLPAATLTSAKHRVELVNDVPTDQWQSSFQQQIDGAIILARTEKAHVVAAVEEARAAMNSAGVTLVGIEWGFVLRNESRQAIEPFGFADGVSQPLFFADNISAASNTFFDASANLSLVLAPDANHEGGFGTYVVMRKLAQDVDGWNKAVEELASRLHIPADRAGALAVGRDQAGVPLITMDKDGKLGKPASNAFNYTQDPKASACPFHAHIRKTNPRNESGSNTALERSHRIVRRAIPFDPKMNGDDVSGLLFVCMQANIEHQFEFMQQSWSNSPTFLKPGTGIDPVIGQSLVNAQDPQDQKDAQTWPNQAGQQVAIKFGKFVTMRGGEYFFQPSVGFFANL